MSRRVMGSGQSNSFGSFIGVGSGAPPTNGLIRFGQQATGIVVMISELASNGSTNLEIVSVDDTAASPALYLGDNGTAGTHWTNAYLRATNVVANIATAFFVANAANTTDFLEVDSTAVHGAVPFAGSSLSSKTFAFAEATVAMADANQTPAAAVYQCPHIILTGALTAARDLVLPATVGAFFIVDNQCTGAFSVNVKVAGQTGVAVTNGGHRQIVKLNSAHTDYIGVTALL